MEKPDADGFVNVMWPSKNVPHGGIFHTRIAKSSSEQQQFLKVLLEESRLNMKLRKGSSYGLRREASPKARTSTGSTEVIVRPHTSRRRSLSAIRQNELLDEYEYRPQKKGEDREKMKDRLANTMAFGDTPEQVVPKPLVSLTKKHTEKKLPTEKQKWHELVTQIRERAEWLAEMEYLGEGGPHREINEQIAERMRALDALGIESECSTARSNATGFSTTRSSEKVHSAVRNQNISSGKSNSTKGSAKSDDRKKRDFKPMIKIPAVENVADYNKISPLAYSPRRRQ